MALGDSWGQERACASTERERHFDKLTTKQRAAW